MTEGQLRVKHILNTLMGAERAMFMRDLQKAKYHTESALDAMNVLIQEQEQELQRQQAELAAQKAAATERNIPKANPLDAILNGHWGTTASSLTIRKSTED